MHSAFNLLVFPNSMFTSLLLFFTERAICSPEKLHLRITIIIIIVKLKHESPQLCPFLVIDL